MGVHLLLMAKNRFMMLIVALCHSGASLRGKKRGQGKDAGTITAVKNDGSFIESWRNLTYLFLLRWLLYIASCLQSPGIQN